MIPSTRTSRTPRTALTAPQRDIWVAHARFPHLPQFTVFASRRYEGTGDVGVFRECVERAVRRNDALRLRFGEDGGAPCQWVSEIAPEVRMLDLSSSDSPKAACEAWIADAFERPVDLGSGPAVEVAILVESASAWHLHLKAHHIVADGWSMNLLFDQIQTDYRRLTGGSEGGAPPGAPSYLDFAVAEDEYRDSPRYQADREYFRATLDGVEPALFERGAPSGARRTGRYSFVIPRTRVERIRARGESPFAVIAAAFTAYLDRIHRAAHPNGDVVLGIPLFNRRGDAERRTVGHFVNTLPLVLRDPGRGSMRELVARVGEGVRELQRHERIGIGDILRDRGGAARGLFDVTLAYNQWPAAGALPGLAQTTVTGTRAHDHEVLAVVCDELGDSGDVRVNLDYALDVFDQDFPIGALARHVRNLLVRGMDAPDRPLGEISMLDDDEWRNVVDAPNATEAEFPAGKTLPALFEEQAARTPERIALVTSDDSFTYAELDTEATRLAGALRGDGVGPDDPVVVMLERGPRMLVAILAVLKAGGAYVPVDPGHPEERIRFLVEDSGAKVVVTDAAAPPAGARVRRADLPLTGEVNPLLAVASDRDLAYVIYTSGSTGQPKGVTVEHRSVVNRLHWMQRRYPLGEDDVLLQKTPVTFDVSVWELFWWGQTGARLALLPPGAERDPREILTAVERFRVTTIHFVPSMLGPFLDAVEEAPGTPTASLRRVFCSGEALPPDLVARFARVFGENGPALVNLYGPTEATVDVSFFDCPRRPVDRVPIGRPIDNIRLYVLGADDQPQPVGAVGELCVSGVGVARGYLGRDDATKEKFVADPFVAGARMYRTGDLARRLADGELEFLGRADEQVKIRGNRVEPGEVRHSLVTLPGVRDAVVVSRRSPDRGEHLVGYYVADEVIEPARIRAHLAESLPEYLIPAWFVRIDAIPLTPNGKADRRALPEPAHEGTPAPGRTPAEAVLAAVWSDVLGVDIGPHDDYYTLGGDSILMLRIRAEAARQGLGISLADIAAHPTVAELAAHAVPVTESDRPLERFELVPGPDRARLAWAEDAYPATRLQLGLLFHSRERQGTAVYHDVFRYSFGIEWDEHAFRWALDRLVARHPALRTSFDLADYAEPLQVVHRQVASPLSIEDLTGVGDPAAEERIRAYIDERRVRGYDFARPPLCRFRAFVRPGALDLVFSFHHAIIDGWSAAILISELFSDYLHGLGADVDPVPAVELPSAAEYVRLEREALEHGHSAKFWREALDGSAPARLEGYAPHEPPGPEETIIRWFDLPDGLEQAVRRFAHEQTVPVRSVYLTAHCSMLRILSGASDITTGLFTHGRPERPGAERIAGLFLNTLPLRLSGSRPSWLSVVHEVVRQEREALPHRWYPLSAIKNDRGSSVVETAFNYVHLHVLEPVLRADGVEFRDFQVFEETNFELVVHVIVDPVTGRMRLRVDGDGRIFTHGQAGVVARTFFAVLSRIVEHPGEVPGHDFLAAPPREVAPAAVPPRHAVSRFAEMVAARPEAVAVAAGGQRWTYRRLGEVSERIARRLIALGADNRQCVGFVLDRSPEMVAAVLGIVRAGAACVPLDVTYPPERLALMTKVASPLRILAHGHRAGLVADPSLIEPIEPFLGKSSSVDEYDGPLPEVSPEDTACILFTSGSTGRPKGAELPHRLFAYYLEWQLASASGAVGGKTLQFAPPSFDVSFQEIFSTLSGGGTLQIITEEDRRDPVALARLLDREEVERVFMPYVALQQLAETVDSLGLRPRALRVIISSGEQLRVTGEIRKLCAGLPGTVLENQYGPTETHLITTFTMTGDPAAFPALPPIGPPFDYLEAHVLDSRMRPVPEGVAGEVYVGGVGLSHGYRGEPELTAKAFVPHPWRPGDRLYRVGDLARVLPSGDLVYLGRVDDQVKVRGFRVEPAEVEFALLALAREHPGLREAAVVARRRDGGDAFLAAFLVGERDSADLDEIRRTLRESLPEYLVPSYFTWLPRMPKTPSGKRDDAALRATPLAVRPAIGHTAPRDDHERTLAEIMSGLLGLPEGSGLSVHDDFFAAGGTSLTAMRLIVMIEKHFGVHLPLAAFVTAPTVAELARRIRSGAPAFDPLVPIRPDGERPPLFLVHPLGGNVVCYLRLARHLPEDQPLYALQAPGITPGTEPASTVEEMAAAYLAAIRRVRPRGPYAIGGWSFGGFVAFEIARQLRLAGDEVANLIVIDSIGLVEDRAPEPDSAALQEWFFWELLWSERGGAATIEGLPTGLGEEERLDFIADRAAEQGILPPAVARSSARRLFRLYRASWTALGEYRPAAADLDLTLLRADERLPKALRPMHGGRSAYGARDNGWGSWTTGRIDVVGVPGDHLTLMDEPHVRAVATAIDAVTTNGEATRKGVK
ncbi:amino acid adenylation domain-containing protein [Amycolatopsis pigmentata]|uniref:Amino acid adenylation domain-containing protein n=1 Tax=Amycolatopsis pigmentata TaxID=450801 RepID=A0ABW5G424_9PSEU